MTKFKTFQGRQGKPPRQVALELLSLQEAALNWTTDVESSGHLTIEDPPGGNYEYLDLALDILGVPPDSDKWCRDWWYDQFHESVMRSTNPDSISEFIEIAVNPDKYQ